MELLAVYGTLKEGFHNHRVLPKGSRKKGTTRVAGWRMYSLGGFPYITHGAFADDVLVEVYEVPDLRATDALEGYHDGYAGFYDRMKVRTEFGDAWIYFFPDAANLSHPRVVSGEWEEFYEEA